MPRLLVPPGPGTSETQRTKGPSTPGFCSLAPGSQSWAASERVAFPGPVRRPSPATQLPAGSQSESAFFGKAVFDAPSMWPRNCSRNPRPPWHQRRCKRARLAGTAPKILVEGVLQIELGELLVKQSSSNEVLNEASVFRRAAVGGASRSRAGYFQSVVEL